MTECYSHQPVLYLCVGSQCTMYELSHDCMLLTPAYAVCVCVPSVWCMSSVMTERCSHQPLLCLCVCSQCTRKLMKPLPEWGPALKEHRIERAAADGTEASAFESQVPLTLSSVNGNSVLLSNSNASKIWVFCWPVPAAETLPGYEFSSSLCLPAGLPACLSLVVLWWRSSWFDWDPPPPSPWISCLSSIPWSILWSMLWWRSSSRGPCPSPPPWFSCLWLTDWFGLDVLDWFDWLVNLIWFIFD